MWLPKSQHFVQVFLKSICIIPQIFPKWTSHSIKEAKIWPNNFLNGMEKFTKLSDIETIHSYIYIGGETFLYSF